MSEAEIVMLTRKEACQFLARLGYRVSPARLSNMANNNNAGGGPPFYRIHQKTVRYRPDDLKSWLDARTRRIA